MSEPPHVGLPTPNHPDGLTSLLIATVKYGDRVRFWLGLDQDDPHFAPSNMNWPEMATLAPEGVSVWRQTIVFIDGLAYGYGAYVPDPSPGVLAAAQALE